MSAIAHRLAELGIELPSAAPPIASYVPWVHDAGLLHVSGQLSSGPAGGVVGVDLGLDEAVGAARLCGLNLLAQLQATLGDLDRIRRVVKLGVFVQAGAELSEIPRVANGCSDLMVEVFGDAGRHARSAVGVYRLPRNFAVEVDAVVAIS